MNSLPGIGDKIFENFRQLNLQPLSPVKIAAIREWARDKALAPISIISLYTLDNVFYLDIIRAGLLKASVDLEQYKKDNAKILPLWVSSAASWDVVIKRTFTIFSLIHDVYCDRQYDVLVSVYNEETKRLYPGQENLLLRQPSRNCRGVSTLSSL